MHAAAHRTDPPATPSNPSPDRRRHGRVRCPGVTCRFAGQVQDMSASGLRLKLDRPSPITADSHLMLVVGAPGRSVEVKARVVWSTARGTGHDLGLQFDSPGPSVRTALFNLAWNGPDGAGPAGSLGLAESGASRE